MNEPISGSVAAIIDDSTLVLNVGYREGAQADMVFTVFAEGQEVKDPQTGEVLGKWEMVKAEVVVSHVQERLSTARSLPIRETERAGTLSAQMVQDSFSRSGGKRQKLDVRGADISGRPQSQPIAVGDKVRQKTQAAAES